MAKMDLGDSLLLWINKDSTVGFVILNGKFNPQNVLGAEFQKLNKEEYNEEPSLVVPFNSSVRYDKELVDIAKKMIELMGYTPKLYAPIKGDIPMIIYFSGDDLNYNKPPKVMVIAPKVDL